MSRFSVRNFGAAAGKPDSPAEAMPTPSRGWLRSAGGGSGSGDERGITLQTLIVTAVLVLMAVAAGVVIVAITNNSADDLEDQTSNIEGRCQPWEIHDPQLEAAGVGGGEEHVQPGGGADAIKPDREGEGGVTSSRIGCLAPCYLGVLGPMSGSPDTKLQNARLALTQYVIGGDNGEGANFPISRYPTSLKFDTSNRPPQPEDDPNALDDVWFEYRLGVTYERDRGLMRGDAFITGSAGMSLDFPPTRYADGHFSDVRALGTHTPIDRVDSKFAVRVTAGQDACVIYNTDNDNICVDSSLPIRQQVTGLC